MADEIALNVLSGDDKRYEAFMFTRSTGYHSGNWFDLKLAFKKAILENQNFGRLNYYKGRPFIPIAGKSLIKWSEE